MERKNKIRYSKSVIGIFFLFSILFLTLYLHYRRIDKDFYNIEYRLRTGDVKWSQNMLEDFISRHPKYKKGWILLAETYRKQSNYEKARNAIAKYRTLDRKDNQYWVQLAYIEKAKGNFPEVQRLLSKAIEQNPKLALPHLEMGNYHLNANNIHSAISEYSTAIYLEPKWVVPHLALANILTSINPIEAEKEFDVAFRLRPRDLIEQRLIARGHLEYANFLYRNDRFSLAKQHYKIVLMEPFDFETNKIRAYLIVCLLNQGLQDDAYLEFKKAYPLFKNNPQNILFLAYLYCCFSQFDQAKLLLQNTLFHTKQLQREALYLLIQIYLIEKNYQQGVLTAKRMVEIDNKDYLGYALLGLFLRDTEQFAAAKKAFQKSFSISTIDSYVHIDYAYLLYLENRIQPAIQECKVALELNKKNFEAMTLLGDLYLLKNEPNEALLFYSNATTINPFYPGAYSGLYRLYLNKKDNSLAQMYLNTFKIKEKEYGGKKFLFLRNYLNFDKTD